MKAVSANREEVVTSPAFMRLSAGDSAVDYFRSIMGEAPPPKRRRLSPRKPVRHAEPTQESRPDKHPTRRRISRFVAAATLTWVTATCLTSGSADDMPHAPPGSYEKVVIAGDSIAAGLGGSDVDPSQQMPGVEICARSTNAPGMIVARQLGAMATNIACPQRTIQGMSYAQGIQNAELPQLERISELKPDLVILSIGANHIDLAEV